MASTRSQARQGGKLPAVTQKPIGEMTLRELIAERSRGEPIQSARSKGKRNKKADAAPGRMRTVVELSSVPYGKAGSSIYNGA